MQKGFVSPKVDGVGKKAVDDEMVKANYVYSTCSWT